MAVLLFFSAFMSGAETAFFSLTYHQIEVLSRSTHRLDSLVTFLMSRPRKLLTSILFGNMAVNVLYFALSSVISVTLGENAGNLAGAVSAVIFLFLLVLLGEMLPKSLAYSHAVTYCRSASPIALVLMNVLSPILRGFDLLLITPAVRLINSIFKSNKPASQASDETVTVNQFKKLIESSRKQGEIGQDENQLLSQVVEMSLLKVRHVMRPRVDIFSCDVNTEISRIKKLMRDEKLTRLLIYSGQIDNIIGMVYLRDVLLNENLPCKKLVKDVTFVPEQKNVESLLDYFRKKEKDIAVVVDEYGGIAGLVLLEDIIEEIIGPFEDKENTPAVEPLGPLKYRLSGSLPVHDWAPVLGVNQENQRIATVAGLVTDLFGKIPEQGERLSLKNVSIEVEKIKKNRIISIILSLEPSEKEQTE
jgi:CBS domain containing-hemolysin-like protein